MRRFVSLALFVTAACDGAPPCDRPCYSACDRYEVVACEIACPAGTSETTPVCDDAAVPCEKSCWSGCPASTTTVVACGASCPEGTTELPRRCDAGSLLDGGFDGGVDAGAPPFCATLAETDVLRVVAEGPVVPEGSYWEPAVGEGEVRSWVSFQCVESIDVLRDALVRSLGAPALTGDERVADQFYEVDVMNGVTLYHYRQDRCDYFDGLRIGGVASADLDALVDLAGYVWFRERQMDPDSRLLDGDGELAGARVRWTSCTAQRTRRSGEPCDRIVVYQRVWSMGDGIVSRGEERPVNAIDGECS